MRLLVIPRTSGYETKYENAKSKTVGPKSTWTRHCTSRAGPNRPFKVPSKQAPGKSPIVCIKGKHNRPFNGRSWGERAIYGSVERDLASLSEAESMGPPRDPQRSVESSTNRPAFRGYGLHLNSPKSYSTSLFTRRGALHEPWLGPWCNPKADFLCFPKFEFLGQLQTIISPSSKLIR